MTISIISRFEKILSIQLMVELKVLQIKFVIPSSNSLKEFEAY